MAEHLASSSPSRAHSAPSAAGLAASPASADASGPSQTERTAIPLDSAAVTMRPVPKARPRFVGAASREYARCDLCGESLGSHSGQFPMVSPLTASPVSVCRTCRRAALSEGYRPRA